VGTAARPKLALTVSRPTPIIAQTTLPLSTADALMALAGYARFRAR